MFENNFVQDSSVISFMQSQGENAQTLQALLKSKAEADYD